MELSSIRRERREAERLGMTDSDLIARLIRKFLQKS
jgi:hypothetical protein